MLNTGNDNNIDKYFHEIKLFVSIMFFILTAHNYLNYIFNAIEEQKIEKRTYWKSWFVSSIVELIFFITMNCLIWSAFCTI